MAEMSPTEAASALRELEDYEQHLGQQLGGITIMVWGVVGAAIFLLYGVTAPLLRGTENAVMAVLWMPLVAAGAVITHRLWQRHAISLGTANTSLRDTVLLTVAFLVAGSALFLGVRAAGIEWGPQGLMTSVNGLVAAGMAFVLRRHGGRGWSHLFSAGLAMTLGGVLLGILELAPGPATLAAAAMAGTSWFLAGFAIHLQG